MFQPYHYYHPPKQKDSICDMKNLSTQMKRKSNKNGNKK